MSRSRRKTPIIGITTCDSEKWWKCAWHRRYRRKVRGAIRMGEDMPSVREVSNIYDAPKDGKMFWGLDSEDFHPHPYKLWRR